MTKRRSIFALLLIIAFAVLPLIAQQEADRVKSVGGKFLCTCGCGQILTQCNHVGCTASASMLKELNGWVKRGDSDETISKAFVAEFGTTVYAEPPKTGISLIAWAMPVIYFLVGAGLVIFVIRKWRRAPVSVPASTSGGAPASSEALNRARAQAARETED